MTGFKSKKAAAQDKLDSMEREALKLALEVLENGDVPTPENVGKNLDAITAIKAVLAQPEQRPWVYLTDEHIKEIVGPYALPIIGYTRKLFDQIEAKSKELNT